MDEDTNAERVDAMILYAQGMLGEYDYLRRLGYEDPRAELEHRERVRFEEMHLDMLRQALRGEQVT